MNPLNIYDCCFDLKKRRKIKKKKRKSIEEKCFTCRVASKIRPKRNCEREIKSDFDEVRATLSGSKRSIINVAQLKNLLPSHVVFRLDFVGAYTLAYFGGRL